MSVSPMSSTPPPSESYFSQLSTRWDIVKFVAPWVVIVIAIFTAMYYTQLAQGQEQQQQSIKIAGFQDAKESRGERLIVVETKLGNVGTRLDKLEEKLDKLGDKILERLPAK